jgi:RNA polymerase sigma-70 factor (ECF subfamily)
MAPLEAFTVKQTEVEWAEWMRLGLAGNAAAYQRLLTALAPVMRATIRGGFQRYGSGLADIEDVVQETLLAIHLKRQTWNPAEPLGPWVRAIARNKLIDNLRRRGRRINVPIDDFLEVLPAPEPEQTLSTDETERLFSVLSDRQREVVQAISVNGETTRDTASRLGITEGAVRIALHRGLAALSAAYRDQQQ